MINIHFMTEWNFDLGLNLLYDPDAWWGIRWPPSPLKPLAYDLLSPLLWLVERLAWCPSAPVYIWPEPEISGPLEYEPVKSYWKTTPKVFVLLSPKFDFPFIRDDRWEMDKRNALILLMSLITLLFYNRGTHVSGIYFAHGFEYDFTQIIVLFLTHLI